MGYTTEMELVAESIQSDSVKEDEADAGDARGIKVPELVREEERLDKVVV